MSENLKNQTKQKINFLHPQCISRASNPQLNPQIPSIGDKKKNRRNNEDEFQKHYFRSLQLNTSRSPNMSVRKHLTSEIPPLRGHRRGRIRPEVEEAQREQNWARNIEESWCKNKKSRDFGALSCGIRTMKRRREDDGEMFRLRKALKDRAILLIK